MIISNTFVAGLEMPIYCEFYNKIYEYINFLNKNYDNKFDNNYELLSICIYTNETGNKLYELYFIRNIKSNKINLYKNHINLNNRSIDMITKKRTTLYEMDSIIKKQKHQFDIEYYINKN